MTIQFHTVVAQPHRYSNNNTSAFNQTHPRIRDTPVLPACLVANAVVATARAHGSSGGSSGGSRVVAGR